jgi:hypothetical protein
LRAAGTKKKVPNVSGLLFYAPAKLCHNIGNGPELQPPLLTRSLIFHVGHTVEVSHIMKDEFSILQANETGARVVLITSLDQMLEA